MALVFPMYLIETVQYAPARKIGQGVSANGHLNPATVKLEFLLVHTVDAMTNGIFGSAAVTKGGTESFVKRHGQMYVTF